MPDFFIQVRSGSDYTPKLFAPEWVGPDGIGYKYQQQGGLAEITIDLALPFEALPLAVGDYIEVCASGEFDGNGRILPRARGRLTLPEGDIETTEHYALTATGLMNLFDKVVINQTFLDPVGANQDLSWYAAQVVTQAEKLLPSFLVPLTRDLETTGISLAQLSAAPATARSAMDSLYEQGAGSIVWGFDIDPSDGRANRVYLRPRASTIEYQFFVGGSVQHFTYPAELDLMVNEVLIQGGDATYPNLLTNASFEVPTNPTSDSGSLLDNGGFEIPYSGDDVYPGGDTNLSPWVGSGGVTRNMYDPSTNHNGSPHTGGWYLLLDSTSKSVYQDIDVSSYPAGTQFIAYLFARNENALHVAEGVLDLVGMNSSGGDSSDSSTLDIDPLSATWTGGTSSATIGSDSLQVFFTKNDSTTTTIRVKIACTSTSGAGYGLMIDDVVLAVVGGPDVSAAVGQLGWATHLRNEGSSSNVVQAIAWASDAAKWDGAYGVRIQVTASNGNEVYINPAGPDLDPNSQYHVKVQPQQDLLFGFRVRMLSGGGAGSARVEWREWASDGHQDSVQQSDNFTIADDGDWHTIVGRFTTHGDAVTGSTQLAFAANGTYDVDGAFVRDAAGADCQLLIGLSGWTTSGEDDHIQQLCTNDTSQQNPVTALYLQGTKFQRDVRAEDVCPATGGQPGDSGANASASTYGRLQAIYTNDNMIDWTSDAIAIMAAYFRRAANLVHRAKLVLIDDQSIVLPGDTGQIQVSGTTAATDPAPTWCSAAEYSWKPGSAIVASLDLDDERPTIAKLLLGISAAAVTSSGGGSADASGGASGGSSATTPVAPTLFQTDTFSVSGTSYTLSQTPDGDFTQLLGDGIEQDASCFSVSGTGLTINCSTSDWETIDFKYSYQPVNS